MQDDIAQSVVKELRTALMGGDAGPAAAAEARAEVQAATVGRTGNAKAYELYLQARSFADKMTEAEGARSIALYEQALALNPGFGARRGRDSPPLFCSGPTTGWLRPMPRATRRPARPLRARSSSRRALQKPMPAWARY